MNSMYQFLCALFLLLLCWQVSSQGSKLVTYPAKILESEQICLSTDQREMARAEITQDIITRIWPCPGQLPENPATSCLEISQCDIQLLSDYYWITSRNGTAIQIYCDMIRACSCDNATVGGWSRVAYLNMTDPTHHCPPEWREIREPVRTCGRINETVRHPGLSARSAGCSSVSFSTYNISYSHICGRIVGYQFGSPDAFAPFTFSHFTRIEDPYVNGVVIVRGTQKQHVWTFAGEQNSNNDHVCPCPNRPNPNSKIPMFVGDDYFCETATAHDDALWDGENCGSQSTCCEFNGPPYFCQSLPETTVDDIEVRICGDENIRYEDTPIQLVEIFVK